MIVDAVVLDRLLEACILAITIEQRLLFLKRQAAQNWITVVVRDLSEIEVRPMVVACKNKLFVFVRKAVSILSPDETRFVCVVF